ncbi:MAG TPA: glucan biosynthesis protein [Gammaproteobacteria bacterium]|nr:glucan biosynthesis protein [Gammaproteobacteria bacterium]
MLSLAVAMLGFAVALRAQERPSEPFDRTILVARAEELAKQPFVKPTQPESGKLEKLSYDQYRSIRFQKGAAIWAHEDRTFTIELFHPGFIYATPVNVNLVTGGTARRVLFTNQIFDYGPDVPTLQSSEDMAYSGFRVRANINTPDYMDEFLVFQGASYFRAVARAQQYGQSARGLAIRTATPEGEEFPVFTDFWVERPAVGAKKVVIHALLQSPSVVGAYTFTATPGDETVMDVDATLFARKEVKSFGIGPLTSMFLFDESSPARFDDYRRAVHDSDGLQILNSNGERVWRQLANPKLLQTSYFGDQNPPRGFGLLQRKRRFDDYEDFEARYELRPSLWVEPRGDWGPGLVELIEIPTDREIHDNIIAFWQPATPLMPGSAANFSYRLRWTAEPLDDSVARVVATRTGKASGEQRTFVIDFQHVTPIPDDLEIHLTSSTGRVLEPRSEKVTPEDVYRVSFELDPERADLSELRLVLMSKGKPWSETWLYRWAR